MSSIGLNVARYRKAEGLSAAELSEKAGEGLSRSVIANLENGRKDDVTVKQLVALANALRVPPATLVADLFDPGSPAAYKMPSVTRKVFVMESLDVREVQTLTRANEFFQWFGGRTMFATEPLHGAQKIVRDALNALDGYNQAWVEFQKAIQEWFAIEDRDSEELDEASEYSVSRAEGRLSTAAENVIRWVGVLDSVNIKNTDTRGIVDRAMAAAGVIYNADQDG